MFLVVVVVAAAAASSSSSSLRMNPPPLDLQNLSPTSLFSCTCVLLRPIKPVRGIIYNGSWTEISWVDEFTTGAVFCFSERLGRLFPGEDRNLSRPPSINDDEFKHGFPIP